MRARLAPKPATARSHITATHWVTDNAVLPKCEGAWLEDHVFNVLGGTIGAVSISGNDDVGMSP